MELTYDTYKKHRFTCPKCNWSGMGADDESPNKTD
jgi:hypothetical protein